jgi:antitoxin ParD1/3/4
MEAIKMSKNTSIVLGQHFTDFVDLQIEHGRYGSTSEVVRAGLRMLEEHETKVNALRSALIEGEQSGAAKTFEVKEFLSKVKKKTKAIKNKRNA